MLLSYAPFLQLVSDAPRPTCLFAQLARSTRSPGVHFLGPHPQHPGLEVYELVSDDGRRLQHGATAAVALLDEEARLSTFWYWRDTLNAQLLSHRCPECPAPRELRRPA